MGTRRRIAKALLALSVVTSGLLAVPATVGAVSICYWGSDKYVGGSKSVANGGTVANMYVTYQVGYGCAGEPLKITVKRISNWLHINVSTPNFGHVDSEAAVLRWFNPDPGNWTWQSPPAWIVTGDITCWNACTLHRERFPNVTFLYDGRASSGAMYIGCPGETGASCLFIYRFLEDKVYFSTGNPSSALPGYFG